MGEGRRAYLLQCSLRVDLQRIMAGLPTDEARS